MKSTPILVVEDDEDLRGLLAMVFDVHGIDAIVVPDATVALRVMNEYRFDVILTDLNLSGDQDGLEVLASGVARGQSVVVMSASPRCDVSLLLGKGAVRVLTKPFDMLNLPRVIDEVRNV